MTTSIPPETDLGALPALPRDDEGPVFHTPWEAQAFAMAVTLHTRGIYTWREWASALAAELAAAAARGEPDDGTHYYEQLARCARKTGRQQESDRTGRAAAPRGGMGCRCAGDAAR